MNWTTLAFDFVARIAWPIFAVVALVILSSSVKAMLERVRRVEGLGAAVEMAENALTAASPDVEQSIEQPGEDQPPQLEAPVAPAQGDQAPHPDVRENAGQDVRVSREELERIVTTFAQAGWALGASGDYAEAPTPAVVWSDAGTPRISTWSGRKRTLRQRQAKNAVSQHTIDEIVRKTIEARGRVKAETSISSLSSALLGKKSQAQGEVEVLQEMLREIDPGNPWGWN